MDDTTNAARQRPDDYGLATRLTHMGLATLVVVQLLTSLVFTGPGANRPGDIWFSVHQYSGMTAFALALVFWLVVAFRRRGTSPGLLFPWFQASRRVMLWQDLVRHVQSLQARRLPDYRTDAPFAAAIHGLGLLLMTAMAASGTLYWLAGGGDPDGGGLVFVAMLIHKPLANLAWAYLIGHAGMALLHHFGGHRSLADMWSLRPSRGAGDL